MKFYENNYKDFVDNVIREFITGSLYMLHELNEKTVKMIYFIPDEKNKHFIIKSLEPFEISQTLETGIYFNKEGFFRIILKNPLYNDDFFKKFNDEFDLNYYKERELLLEQDAFVYMNIDKFIFEKLLSSNLFELYRFAINELSKNIISIIQSIDFKMNMKSFLKN